MTMTAADILEAVKADMGITSHAHDKKIESLTNEVIRFMHSAGLSDEKIESAVGVVSRGVSDLFFNLNDFSKYFYIALTQLKLESEVADVQTAGNE